MQRLDLLVVAVVPGKSWPVKFRQVRTKSAKERFEELIRKVREKFYHVLQSVCTRHDQIIQDKLKGHFSFPIG